MISVKSDITKTCAQDVSLANLLNYHLPILLINQLLHLIRFVVILHQSCLSISIDTMLNSLTTVLDLCGFTLYTASDFFRCLLTFEKLIFRQFTAKMNVLQSDDGGGFVSEKISSHFIAEGVIHQFSRPYTPQQSGLIERRHRLIVEIGLAQLFHSSV